MIKNYHETVRKGDFMDFLQNTSTLFSSMNHRRGSVWIAALLFALLSFSAHRAKKSFSAKTRKAPGEGAFRFIGSNLF